ncbi:SGNH/GDSL hydrolase family protein [Aliikangiella coralliicola]|uniref:SGNH/GDSL hydrolase family protein n=1 Tax=Aliikangiella coralliicola TaxID=2592383 RepID=A0A545UDN2_9GAMM|nr:SGNH/GDSL hydrolase family protein [Aliikangiella coralliicola]TQV87559.1 SGNH/GDSL hydrolase family protein [Aliikangiella coralliicola]
MALTTKEINSLRKKKKAATKREFAQMRQLFPERVNIVSEGDSWFAYPPKWLVWGKQSNLIAHITGWTRRKANFYSMASNGDEAVDMVSGKQKHQLVDLLRWHTKAKHRKPIDLLLFSGGGNDIVGENDFERFLKPYKPSYTTGKQCVNMPRLNRKIKQIGLAYQELLDIRDHYTQDTLIMTHTYDYPYPSLTGGVFLGGLIKTKAWMKRFMDAAGIKEELQADVIKVFMDGMAEEVLKIASKRSGFIVVDTRGTLVGKKEWLNEIHPTSKGFKSIAELMFEEMKLKFPGLQ